MASIPVLPISPSIITSAPPSTPFSTVNDVENGMPSTCPREKSATSSGIFTPANESRFTNSAIANSFILEISSRAIEFSNLALTAALAVSAIRAGLRADMTEVAYLLISNPRIRSGSLFIASIVPRLFTRLIRAESFEISVKSGTLPTTSGA